MRLGTFSNGGLGFGLAFSLVDDFSMNARKIEREMAKLDGSAAALAVSVETSMNRAKLGAMGMLVTMIGLAGWAKAAKQDAVFQNFELAFRSFLSSADEAHRVFEKIKEQAIANPKFSIAGMEKANLLLISQGVNANKSMSAISDLTTVLLGVGRGEPELQRVALAFEKIQAGGFLTGPQYRSLTTAGLPVVRMLKAIGISLDGSKIAKAKITFEQLIAAMHNAVNDPKLFGRVWEMMAGNVSAKAAQIKENFSATMGDIGKAIRPATLAILNAVGAILDKLRQFAGTTTGKWVFRLAFALNVLLFAMSAVVAITALGKIMMLRMAGAFGATTKASVLTALGAGNVSGAFGIMGKQALIASRGLALMVAKWALFYVGYKLVSNTNNSFLYLLGTALMFLMGPLGVVAGIFLFFSRSFREFDAVMTGTTKPLGGLVGMFQKLGAIMTFVGAAWSGFNAETNEIEVPKKLMQMMDYLGLGDTARGIATWIGRLHAAWNGFTEGLSEGWHMFTNAILSIANIFSPVNEQFTSWGQLIGLNSTRLESWKERGKAFGKAMGIVFGSLILALGVIAIAMAVNAVIGAAMWLAWLAPLLLVIAAAVALVNIIESVMNALTGTSDSADGSFTKIATGVNNLGTTIGGLEPQFMGIGQQLGNGLVKGIQGKLDSWVDNHLSVNISDGWAGLGIMKGDTYRYSPFGTSGWKSERDATDLGGYMGSKGARMLDSTMSTMHYQPAPAGAPSNDNGLFGGLITAMKESNAKQPITINLQVDGRTLSQYVIDSMKYQKATEYNDSSYKGSVAAQDNNVP